ncbi:uncharacterized protein FOMMEDRAFT_159325 [Fomitiporia mediterranea MF3/22]|uniref:uncharacterized protein n=1 Tax=Fomitiporia mediterranea (strain MF3/22) TaxID=694068 RepID=UPI0004408520|nr:uncharacterized protein FOMMEDRAFT_159325 [Fomitiporia mediterranea MF3/22]EJD00579.1 hypothetical protein FOMMEDRAFT_159325 [Fomitiporia mediterranea MF3/22]
MQIISYPIRGGSPFVASLLGRAGDPTVLCILGSRLLINLKEAGERGMNRGTSHGSRVLSDVEFAEGLPVADSNEEGTRNA